MGKSRSLWIPLLAIIALVGLHCGEDTGSDPSDSVLTIVPDSSKVDASSSRQFEVSFQGEEPAVKWYVMGVEGGDPTFGMITKDGMYVAPDHSPIKCCIMVEARGINDPALKGTAKVLVNRTDETPFIVVSPETVTVNLADSVQFSSQVSGCPYDEVIWSVKAVSGSPSTLGTIRPNGLYTPPALPDTDFVLVVKATSTSCADKTGIARAFIVAGLREFKIELEDFTEKFDSPGSVSIRVASCKSASGGQAVEGLDASGEWIEVPVRVPAPGTYAAKVSYSANLGAQIKVNVAIRGCVTPAPEADFVLDQGTGIT